MSASTQGVAAGTTPVDLTPNVTGDGANSAWHKKMSSNSYAFLYVILALAALWGLGYSFR